MSPTYAATPRAVRAWWTAGLAAAVGYGLVLVAIALQVPVGDHLTGRFTGQPVVKSAMGVLLAVAAWFHPILRERRWLVSALLLSAVGDFLLAVPWWKPAFVGGLGAFLVAHLCYLAALLPLRGKPTPARLFGMVAVLIGCAGMLLWFWPQLAAQGMRIPVVIYMSVLGAMVCTALMARLPTMWTALGALLFAASDGMIGVGQFVLRSEALELPIWWVYAPSQLLITAGFFFGRGAHASNNARHTSNPDNH